MVYVCLGGSCYINVDTGNSSYTNPSALAAAAAAADSHGNVMCSITLTNPVRYYNDRVLNTKTAVTSHDDDDDDDGTYCITVHYMSLRTLTIIVQ